MTSGLNSGAPGLNLGTGLIITATGTWSGAAGLQNTAGSTTPGITISLTPNQTIQPFNSFGWTAAIISSSAPNTTYVLTVDASGQFTIGGDMLRLEKALGVAGTTYNISIQASASGYATTTTSFAITVTNSYTTGLVERINALDLSKMWQDTARTSQVTADGQSVKAINGSIAGWQAENATGPTYKAAIQNGKGVLRFSGASQMLAFTSSAAINFFGASWLNTPWTIIFVFAQTSYATGKDLLGWGTGAVNYAIFNTSTSGALKYTIGSGGATTSDQGTGTLAAGAFGIQSVTSDGAPDTVHLGFSKNGVYGYTSPGVQPTAVMAEISSTYTGGAMAPTVARIGARAFGAPTYFAGDVCDILIYNRTIGAVEMEYIQSQLGVEWGITTTATTPTLDKSSYSLWWADDFDGTSLNMNTVAYTGAGQATLGSDGNPTGWTPAHIAGASAKTAYGSVGSQSAEAQWNIDTRNAAFAANGITDQYTVANSSVTIKTYATPAPLSANVASKSYLGGYLETQGWKARQFGIIEFRAKAGKPQAGNYPALWLMPENGAWNDEIDVTEQASLHGNQFIMSNAHASPYYYLNGVTSGSPFANMAYSAAGLTGMGEPTNDGFHSYAVKWDENGCFFYYDGRLSGQITAWAGVYALVATVPGAGLTNGTYNIYGTGGTGTAKATLTVAGGTITAVSITSPGGGFSAQPTWWTNAAFSIALNTTLPGVTLTASIGTTDPALRPTAHEPFYAILQQALDSVGGTFNPALGYYPETKFDFVRYYKLIRPDPARLTPGYDPAFDTSVATNVTAIVSAYATSGVTLSAGTQTALSTLVRGLMAWQLRFDTQVMGGQTADWDNTKLSLWDAMDLFYLPALSAPNGTKATSKINLKNPGTGDLNEVGAGITFAAQTGLSLPGTAAVYLNSGVAASQWNNQDNGFQLFLPAAPTNGSNACLTGYTTQCRWDAASGSYEIYPGGTAATTTKCKTKSLTLTGHVVIARGYRHGVNLFQNGEFLAGSYVSSNATSVVSGNFKIGSYDGSTAGAAFSFLAASTGRRLMQEEADRLNTLLRTFFTAVGVTVSV